jgi:hypothetical protein
MKSVITAAFAIVATASIATAETNTFADRVAFEASVAGLVTEDFQTINGVGDFHAGTVDIGHLRFKVTSAKQVAGHSRLGRKSTV